MFGCSVRFEAERFFGFVDDGEDLGGPLEMGIEVFLVAGPDIMYTCRPEISRALWVNERELQSTVSNLLPAK